MLGYLGCCSGVTASVLAPARCCRGGGMEAGGDACTHSLQDGLGH